MKQYLFLILFFALVNITYSQTVNYDNNAATGKYYNIRGMKMYCEVYGSGKPLLMIHGNGGNLSAFSKTIPYFEKKYKVIATDSRAQGKSVDTNDSLSFEMMADDEAALLDSMHIDSAYVIGWSDGGIVALILAMRHPEKVIKLVSTGANLTPDSTGVMPDVWKYEQHIYDSLHTHIFTSAKEKAEWKTFMLDWLQPNVPFDSLEKIKCPSLIMCGDHDLIPIEHTTKIYEHIPQAYLWVVPNSGHPTLIEHADEFNAKVDDFFAKPFNKR